MAVGLAAAEFPLRHQDNFLAVAEFYDRDVRMLLTTELLYRK